MKTKNASPVRQLVPAALFLALAFVLPLLTGQVAAPLLRSVLFGMPPMFPVAISMAFELATYGAVSGWMYKNVRHTLPMMYAALATAMVAGRLVWGAMRFVLAGLSGSAFPFSAFLSGALLTAVPGIIAQLILIPLILTALQKAKFMD